MFGPHDRPKTPGESLLGDRSKPGSWITPTRRQAWKARLGLAEPTCG